MKTIIIYGIEHKGNTYNAVQLFKNNLNLNENDVTEYFLPKDMPYFCVGCNNCFMKGEEFCPYQKYITPIKEAILNAELIILASPVYLSHITGQMKTLLDHFAFQYMNHRPNKLMFSKTALVVSIAAGVGMKSAIKDMTGSLEYWGISRIYNFGFAVHASNWNEITDANKLKIEQMVKKISNKILLKKNERIKPNHKIKGLFYLFRMLHNKSFLIPYDRDYWKSQGWLDKKRPWRNK
jgi:multimeric flavodoxin WrbA